MKRLCCAAVCGRPPKIGRREGYRNRRRWLVDALTKHDQPKESRIPENSAHCDERSCCRCTHLDYRCCRCTSSGHEWANPECQPTCKPSSDSEQVASSRCGGPNPAWKKIDMLSVAQAQARQCFVRENVGISSDRMDPIRNTHTKTTDPQKEISIPT